MERRNIPLSSVELLEIPADQRVFTSSGCDMAIVGKNSFSEVEGGALQKFLTTVKHVEN